MKKLSIILLILGLSAILIWSEIRQPHSAASDLPQVSLLALTASSAEQAKIPALVDAIRNISGVTAASFNASSGILGLTFLSSIPEQVMQKQLVSNTRIAFQKVSFASVQGSECPVPAGLIRAIPLIALLTGIGLILSSLGILAYLRAKA